ncbi:MAG TPA: response regulator transcription factor [Streptosporangiaceae bacterium]|nr:response regulator transcription factor [Streptosporangiaceae bacterium]
MTRLVLGDHHVVFLDALSTVLSQHGYGVGAVARSSPEMVALVRAERPEVCLVDRHAPMDDDAETIGRLRAASEHTSVVVVSGHPGREAAGRAVNAGASGYLHQSRGIGALVTALERVLAGEVVVDVPEAVPPARRSAEPNQALRLARHLTSRERQCLLMLVEGLDTAAMVARLGVSRTTVRTHLQSVLTKLGVHSRLEAVSFAVRHRLPDLWSGDSVHAAAPRPDKRAGSARLAPMRSLAPRPVAAVRPIRPRQVLAVGADLGKIDLGERRPLAVAAGQGASAG